MSHIGKEIEKVQEIKKSEQTAKNMDVSLEDNK